MIVGQEVMRRDDACDAYYAYVDLSRSFLIPSNNFHYFYIHTHTRSQVSHNKLTGSLPCGALGYLTKLRTLDLQHNHIEGRVEPFFAKMVNT